MMETTATLESTAVHVLNDLLKDCLAARETYAVAIRRIERRHDEAAIALRVMHQDHAENARKLQKEVLALGGDPEEHTGASGMVAKAVEGVASFLGDASGLRALREGEERCLSDARKAMPELEGSARTFLEMTLIPRLGKHVELLDTLIARA
ncbi:MAG TPA: DUF2383 domain-containing protein [Thermoanaerobaculia bacterium]|nr:DUF2383 domain-containing protein [Thermoanaerobaculia bacterium]